MLDPHTLTHQAAARDFEWARRQAALQQLMARLTGKSAELLPYAEVSEKLKVSGMVELGLREIPLDAIVGSVGRYQDFTRGFFPKSDSDAERWTGILKAVNEMRGMPPIEVYQIGEVYFVKDGNHRVSVARQLHSPTIAARVTQVKTRVPLTAEADLAEVINKSHYADFLEQTNLDRLCPGADLTMTFADQYGLLLEQIEEHRAWMVQQNDGQAVSDDVAVKDWYKDVYLPVVKVIREQGVMRRFPERTEADLYVLVSEHRAELEEALGWELEAETAVPDLADQLRPRYFTEWLRWAVVPPTLAEGPSPGDWRSKRLAVRQRDSLFTDILLGLRGGETDWEVVKVALQIAGWENGRLHGLHILKNRNQMQETAVLYLRDTFLQQCQTAGITADFIAETGNGIARTLLKRASWSDLLIINLAHPPQPRGLSGLSHGVTQLIQRCPRPILTIPGQFFPLDHALLAYDGSPKADEALFVAAYLAVRWQMTLTVVTVETQYTPTKALEWARDYLQPHGIEANYVLRYKTIDEAILETAESHHSDLLIMGGFGYRPIQHLVLGSTVDQMLREFNKPILICR